MEIWTHIPTMTEFIESLPIIFSVVLLDGLLSVDNGLIIAARAQHLEGKKRKLATNIGMTAALLLRLASLFCIGFLLANPWLKLLGGAYLVHMMCAHLGRSGVEKSKEVKVAETFASAVVSIIIADFVFSIDNVIAAASLSPKLWVVWTGVTASIFIMMFAVSVFARLLTRFPILESLAYLLVGFIGLQLFAEYFFHMELAEMQKFGAIIGIIVAGLLYDRVKLLQRLLGPIFYWVARLMGLIASLVDFVMIPIVVPVKAISSWLAKLFSKKS